MTVQCEQMRLALMTWFDSSHRVLPWRYIKGSKLPGHPQDAALQALSTQDFAYRVLVSEVMLQQTQVATVIDYFNRWTAKWPTVRDLAVADQEEVNSVWAGLGYYRRAANLLKGAQHVMDKFGGEFPSTAKQLQEIPGVGPYTSAAVASIAFGEPVAAVDGNVHRVMARLLTIPGTTQERAFQVAAATAASELLDASRPGDWNQAVMELGATVCKPAKPECAACVLRSHCKAYAAQQAPKSNVSVTDWPAKAKAAEKAVQHISVCVVRVLPPGHKAAAAAKRRSTETPADTAASASTANAADCATHDALYVLVKRPERDAKSRANLLAGLWEMPGAAVPADATQAAQKAAADARLRELLPASTPSLLRVSAQPCGAVVHLFSHIHMTLHVYLREVQLTDDEVVALREECAEVSGRPGMSPVKLVTASAIKGVGLSSSVLKVLQATKNKLKFAR